MNPTGGKIDIEGKATMDPTFGMPAKWVAVKERATARLKKYTIVEPTTLITTHISEVIKANIADLISYSETQKLIDQVAVTHRKMIKEIRIFMPVTSAVSSKAK